MSIPISTQCGEKSGYSGCQKCISQVASNKGCAYFEKASLHLEQSKLLFAVAVTDEGRTKFFGNGRQNKYMRRKFHTLRQQLGVARKPAAIKRMHDKEQCWMKDQDHKISRGIVNFALNEQRFCDSSRKIDEHQEHGKNKP